MKKVLLVATVQSHIAQFHMPLIRWLQESGYCVDVAAKNNLHLKPNLRLDTRGEIFDIPFSRSPFSLQNMRAYFALKKVIESGQYDVIHCNTPVGGILTRMAANAKRRRGETTVIYEAHGFHFFRGGPMRNWILWYPIEKWFSRYTSVLITINKMDYELAKTKFSAGRIEYLPGAGLDLSRFREEGKAVDLRAELGLPDDAKIVISVGELNKNKNHQVIIRAVAELKDPGIHYVLVGNGPLEDTLIQLAKNLGVEHNVHFLGYRRDVPAILKNADVYAFPSLREGLGLASLEAMASGLPIVTSNRHGINDYSEHGVTGYKYAPNDIQGFARGIREIVCNDDLKRKMGKHNVVAAQQFTIEASMSSLCIIYREILEHEQ